MINTFRTRYKLRKMFGPITRWWQNITLRLNKGKKISCLIEGTKITVEFTVLGAFYKHGKLKKIAFEANIHAGTIVKSFGRTTSTEHALKLMGESLKSKIIPMSSWTINDEIGIDAKYKTFILTLKT